MISWVAAAAAATIVATAALTWLLWRLNAPKDGAPRGDGDA